MLIADSSADSAVLEVGHSALIAALIAIRLGCSLWEHGHLSSAVLRSAEGAKMSNDASQGGIQVNRRLLVGGGVLVGIGGLLGLTGMVLVGSALLSATRQWVNQLERPPSEIARRKWQQAKAAASAGAEAWRNGPQS
jgi:hypothetical protein